MYGDWFAGVFIFQCVVLNFIQVLLQDAINLLELMMANASEAANDVTMMGTTTRNPLELTSEVLHDFALVTPKELAHIVFLLRTVSSLCVPSPRVRPRHIPLLAHPHLQCL
jgi:hypothetical protein